MTSASADCPTFEEFLVAATGHKPFPWQSRLAQRFANNEPVDMLDIPTGTGKSTIVEAHIWAAAANPAHPLRLFVAIDRRVLVTQIGVQAETLQHRMVEALNDPHNQDSPLAVIGRLLSARNANLTLDGSDNQTTPFDVHELRGGQARSNDWVARPDRVAVISSTPDQIGSGILHRAYLLSEGIRPMGAAMFCDSIIAVDEAHLTPALPATLTTVSGMWTPDNTDTDMTGWGAPPRIVVMSATHDPGAVDPAAVIALDADDTAPGTVLAERLAKPRLVTFAADTSDFVTETLRLIDTSDCVLVTVNTVTEAVTLTAKLDTKLRDADVDVVRVTGQQNTHQRNDAMSKLTPFLSGNPERGDTGKIVVVATQSIECGVDLDADALVTAACPWPNLLQRVGRTNRIGVRAAAEVVVVKKGKPGPYDQEHIDACNTALETLTATQCPVDLSYTALQHLDPALTESVAVPANRNLIPHVTAEFVDLWSSNIDAAACPDVAPFIRGIVREDDSQVFVMQRTGMHTDTETGEPGRYWTALNTEIGPQREELIPAKLMSVRSFLFPETGDGTVACLVRNGGDGWKQPASADQITPNMIVAIPSAAGGVDRWGWTGNPKHDAAPVGDPTSLEHVVHADPVDDPRQRELKEGRHRYVTVRVDQPITGWTQTVTDDDFDERHTITFSVPMPPVEPGANTTGTLLLATHHTDVADLARRLAEALNLPDTEADAVTVAASIHDIGKTDERFQQFLNPNRVDGTVHAKGVPATVHQMRQNRQIAGLPDRWRHEAATRSSPHTNIDDELVDWLIHTHHGHGRPFWPHCNDATVPLQQQFDERWIDLRDTLTTRYGAWRLALLESVVRCADWHGTRLRATNRKTTNR